MRARERQRRPVQVDLPCIAKHPYSVVHHTAETTPFWRESIDWTRAALDGHGSEQIDSPERRRLRISLAMQHELEAEWKSGGMRQAFLRFEKRGA